MKKTLILIFGLMASLSTFADKSKTTYNPTLQISVREKTDKAFLKKTTITLADLTKNVGLHAFEVPEHPNYKDKPVKYDGFYFNDVAMYINKKLKIKNPTNYIYSIWASDNFSTFVTQEDLASGKAFLATRELDFADDKNKSEDGRWTNIDKHGSPGPYFLVWDNPKTTFWHKWPFKVAEITLISKDVANAFEKLKPKTDDFMQNKGNNLVMKNCTSCHQVAKTGFANMAPDLKDLAAVRTEADFLKQIRHPAGKMEPFSADVLSDGDVSAIYIYLKSLE